MKLFLSHNSNDKPLVREIRGHWPKHIETWLDEDKLIWGEDLEPSIKDAIDEKSDYIIIFLGEKAVKSEWVKKELAWALEKEKELKRNFILPILLEKDILNGSNIDVLFKQLKERLFANYHGESAIFVKASADEIADKLNKLTFNWLKTVEEKNKKLEEENATLRNRKTDQAELLNAYNSTGITLGIKGLLDEAIEQFTKAIKINPNDAYVYYNRGVAYGEKGELDEEIADYTKAIELKPDYADAYYNRGVAYGEKGELYKAIEDYTKAIELKPDYAEAYNNRGGAYGKKGNLYKAIEDFSKAIELKPDYAEAYYNRGWAYGEKGERDKAIADFDKAIELKPDYAKAYYNRGIAYGEKGELDKAVADFTKAIKLKPDLAEAYNNRGVAYVEKGELDKEIEDFNTAIELKPDLAGVYFNRGVAYVEKGELDKAIADYENFVKYARPEHAKMVKKVKELINRLEKR